MRVVKRKRQFLWKVVGFNACSKPCGGGSQTPIIRCVREAPTRIFSPKRCAHLVQPTLSEHLLRCNYHMCPAYWQAGEWSDCNCGNYDEELYQNREIKCVQELGTGKIIQVNSGACMDEQPLSREKCKCPKYLEPAELEIYKQEPTTTTTTTQSPTSPPQQPASIHHHSQSDLNIIRSHIHTIPRNQTAVKRNHIHIQENKKIGSWLVSEWNDGCSSECGTGIQYRTIFCNRSPPNNERCDLRFTPDTTRHCTSEKKCKYGDWFIGSWSECHGDCFNLKKTRKIFCIQNDVIVSDGDCNSDEKPEDSQTCNVVDIHDCRPKWHTSEWTDVSIFITLFFLPSPIDLFLFFKVHKIM